MEWKTIKENGYPKPGSFVLCEDKPAFNQFSKYHVYYYGKRHGMPINQFWLYDLVHNEQEIIKYCVIN